MNEAETGVYRVLARKYRPQSFADLIGQEAMVRTLRNAFETNRIHQAYIFTGVRGVGKTTTARILARALNYETADTHKPQIEMPVLGEHCQAIIESRHVDVIEMDAASNTSIDNIREIIEAARYKPISARTKVYIIDEVHMLSKAAFNGLLKTLEEPPPHVKFLFATTEIRKVPVTVLSRCQRFDLRRIEVPTMVAYLNEIAAKEGIVVEAEALALISRASEGSMRDALSLLDQAIAHGGGKVEALEVRASLGLADRSRVIDLFEQVMRGDVAAAFAEFENQHQEGAEPAAVLTDLADYVHIVTRLKLMPDAAKDPTLSETEREKGLVFAKTIGIRALTMAWQILLKGLQEVQASARPKMAAEMVLVRLAYAADLPSPDEVIRDWKAGSMPNAMPSSALSSSPSSGHQGGPSVSGTMVPPMTGNDQAPRMVSNQNGASSAPQASLSQQALQSTLNAAPMPRSMGELVALAEEKRDIRLKTALERDMRVLSFEMGRIEIAMLPQAEAELPNKLAKALLDWTGKRWGISVAKDPVEAEHTPTLHEQTQAKNREEMTGIRALPAVQAILKAFPGAEITAIHKAILVETSAIQNEDGDVEQAADISDDDL